MKLSKRLLLVVLPIALGLELLSRYVLIENLLSRAADTETSALNARLTELETSFNQYHSYAKDYVFATTSSKQMQRFLKDDKSYRELSIRSGFKQTLAQFNHHLSKYISFTIVEPIESGYEILLDITHSEDPFAEPYSQLYAISKELLQSPDTERWDYIEPDNGKALIVLTRLIDQITFEQPLTRNHENSVAVQFALEPTEYLKLLNSFQDEYPATVSTKDFSDTSSTPQYGKTLYFSPNNRDKSIEIRVADDFYLPTIKKIRAEQLLKACVFLVIWGLVGAILIRRYVTAPIAALEKNVLEVIEGQSQSIDYNANAKDEINVLATSFSRLHHKLIQSYNDVATLSERDALTGLHNLAYITRSENDILKVAREASDQVAFFYIDLDNFKFVNDQYGHYSGDKLLKIFAERLTNVVNKMCELDPLISRLGGDEFCVIFRGYTDTKQLNSIANEILDIFENGFSFQHGRMPITVSVGISVYPENGSNVSDLISAADSAMYAAKTSGKNQYSYYNHELWLKLNRRLEIENTLKTCNPDEEFELVYMPLVSLNDAAISGFEVLLRWKSPTLGQVSPAEFVPIAESCGLFAKIDHWVIENAFKQYKTLAAKLSAPVKLSVNISSAQLNLKGLANFIEEQAVKYEVAPTQIQFEITETLNVEFDTQASQLLDNLIKQGYQIAIDDFGNGYTALLQLVEFPANVIKFDKTFVDKALHGDNRNMLKPLIDLCHSQDLQVTVEGVETREQAAYLASLGPDFFQGYYFGKPMPLATLTTTIKECESKVLDLSNEYFLEILYADMGNTNLASYR